MRVNFSPPLGMHRLSLNILYEVAVEFAVVWVIIPTGRIYGHKDVIPILALHKLPPEIIKDPTNQKSFNNLKKNIVFSN